MDPGTWARFARELPGLVPLTGKIALFLPPL